jgi:hypothetical protein
MSNPWLPRYGDPHVRYGAGWVYPTRDEILTLLQNENIKPKRNKQMKHQRWFPTRIAEQIVWLENFRTKLATYATTLGLPSAKVTAVIASARFLIYVLSEWLAAVRTFGPATTQAVDNLMRGSGSTAVTLPSFTAPPLPDGVDPVPPGALNLIFDLVAELKEADAYTEAIGIDLGVVGAVAASAQGDTHTAPQIRMEIINGPNGQAVKFTFTKRGHQGIYLEGRRGNGGWEFLAIDTESPYVDERPLAQAGVPEVREYRGRFWDKGTPNGDWTDVLRTTVAP